MFNRPDKTYDFDPSLIQNILKDRANPLNRISDIIPDGSKILDIGAGNGLLAAVLGSKYKQLTIDGIEPAAYGADIARKYYRKLYTGFAEELLDSLDKGYDYIILADVIEHMHDPLVFMKKLVNWMPDKAQVILSVPNIAFGAVRLALLNGNFDYIDSGILERTHLRFFTLTTVKKLISAVNMNIDKLFFLQRSIFGQEIRLKKTFLSYLNLLPLLMDKNSSTYQFLFVLTRRPVIPEIRYFKENKESFVKLIADRFKRYKKDRTSV